MSPPPPMCKRPRENPAGSCQCSVDPVLSSHDAPYFETHLSSQAFFTFVTTLASMEVCFTLFLSPFPSTVQNYIQLSLCTTNHTILQNKRMRRCGVPPPPPPIIFVKLPQQIIHRRKGNLSESPNHFKYRKNILISRFYEQYSRSSRILGHFWKFEKISNS